jgi:chromate reductase
MNGVRSPGREIDRGVCRRETMQILAISGSLRSSSTNTTLLNAAGALAPENMELLLYSALGDLPHFNPDLDIQPAPLAVAEFRSQLCRSAGVIISSPEYAHGVPGVLKNALDWLVASGELYEKPVALFSASPRGSYAQASLTETLNVMMARVVPEACISVPLLGRNLDESGIIAEAEISSAVRSALARFTDAIRRE